MPPKASLITFRRSLLHFNKELRKRGYFIKIRKELDEPGYYTIFILRRSRVIRKAASIKIFLDFEDSSLILDTGRTMIGFRRMGFGTFIRAVVLWAAKRAGFVSAEQTSTHLNKKNKIALAGTRPLSAFIMNKLGFSVNRIHNNLSENRSINLNSNIPNINKRIKEYFNKPY